MVRFKMYLYLMFIAVTATVIVTCSQKEAPPQGISLVNSVETESSLTLDNSLLNVVFDRSSGTFTATGNGVEFISSGNLRQSVGTAGIVTVENDLGVGSAIEFVYPDGNAELIMLFPDVPFICVQSKIANNTEYAIEIGNVVPVGTEIALGKQAGALRTLGADGLTNGETSRTSYAFLAVADPETSAGVVSGWLTHIRASGVMMSLGYRENIRIDARSEYGKLRLDPGETVDGEIYAIGYFENALTGLELFADGIADANDIQLTKPIPSGYCTWYSNPHGGASDEEHKI